MYRGISSSFGPKVKQYHLSQEISLSETQKIRHVWLLSMAGLKISPIEQGGKNNADEVADNYNVWLVWL